MAKKEIKLSILDQSIVQKGYSAKQTLEATIATAKLADALGYVRFWVGEHHNSKLIAGTAPELLMVKLADETSRIRLGSGGIMLPNHSAYKVAENFRTLEILFPGRIDLGMGRAPGTDRLTASLLNPANTFNEADYVRQLDHLQHFFNDTAASQYGPLLASPQSETTPSQWILCSSGGSAPIAAKYGMGLAVAKFINGFAGRDMVEMYRRSFVPSPQLAAPTELVALHILCAETEEKAIEMRKFLDYIHVQFERGNFENMGDDTTAREYVFSAEELLVLERNRGKVISGTQEKVKEQVINLAEELDIEEIMAVCLAYRQEDRETSFRLLAEAFELN